MKLDLLGIQSAYVSACYVQGARWRTGWKSAKRYVLVIPQRWGVYGLYTPESEFIYNPYTPQRRGITDIYVSWALKCSYIRIGNGAVVTEL